MKKISFAITILICISTIAFLIFASYTNVQYDVYNNNPFGLSDNYVTVSIFSLRVEDYSDNRLSDKIKEIINDENVIFLYDNTNILGLGIYYNEKYLVDEKFDVKLGYNEVLLKLGSYTSNISKNDGYIKKYNGEKFIITGYYDENSIFNYSANHDYVYNYFDAPYCTGYYHIDAENKEIIDKLVLEARRLGYECNIQGVKADSFISHLFSITLYATTVLGALFMLINLYSIYFIFISGWKKIINIHKLCGGTKIKIFFQLSQTIFKSISMGLLFGFIIYWLSFANSKLLLPTLFSILTLVSFGILLFLLYSLSFFSLNFQMERGSKNEKFI